MGSSKSGSRAAGQSTPSSGSLHGFARSAMVDPIEHNPNHAATITGSLVDLTTGMAYGLVAVSATSRLPNLPPQLARPRAGPVDRALEKQ
jgi:hypothetical protein